MGSVETATIPGPCTRQWDRISLGFGTMWRWLIILGVAALIWRVAQPGGDCVIRMRRGKVSIRGKLAAGRRNEIERFLLDQFRDVDRLRIDVYYPRGSQRPRD